MSRAIRFAILSAALPLLATASAADATHVKHAHSTKKHRIVRNDGIGVAVDEGKLLTFTRPAKTVFVGNPMIADIQVIDSRHAFILGKTFGITNLIALDDDGKQVESKQVTVVNVQAALTIDRGTEQFNYACTRLHCEAAPRPGDLNSYDKDTDQEIGSHQDLGTKNALPPLGAGATASSDRLTVVMLLTLTPMRAIAAPVRRAGSQVTASIARTFAEHIPLYICAALFCAATFAVARLYGLPLPFEASWTFLELVPKFLAIGIALTALGQLVAHFRAGRRDSPLRAIGQAIGRLFLEGDRPGNSFHALVAMTPLMVCFAAMKDEIPRINPFSWDRTFMQWDRFLGFGHQPWELLQPLLGHPPVTAGINLVYDAWFAIMFGCLFWQAFSARGGITRMQYLLAFAFSWFIAGNVLAAIFSSAGPCFYGQLHLGADPYAAQMTYLHEVNRHWPIWSVTIQNLLWQSYVTGSGAVSGISAMPSMHVASSALIAVTAWRHNKWLGAAVVAFTFLIVLGSIHLAWHYAVDSIAGLALDVAFWWTAGIIARADARWRESRRPLLPARAMGNAA